MGSSLRPIIVGGFYRSGTSLLRRLLDAHSHIHCPAEIKFLPDFFGAYIADPLAHVRFFSTLRTLELPEAMLLEIYGRAYCETREYAMEARSKIRWADKVPENVLYLEAWRAILPAGFLFVNVVREPLDALGSLQEAGFDKTVPSAIEDRVALYRRFRIAAAHWATQHPCTSYELHYEDLVSNPEGALASLNAFLGEPFERDVMVRFRDPAHGGGLEDPKVLAKAHIHSESVGRSRYHLTRGEAAFVRTELSAWSRTHGQLGS